MARKTALSPKVRTVLGGLAILSIYGVVVVLVLAYITMLALNESFGWYVRGVLDPRAGGQVFYPFTISAFISGWGRWSSRLGGRSGSAEG